MGNERFWQDVELITRIRKVVLLDRERYGRTGINRTTYGTG